MSMPTGAIIQTGDMLQIMMIPPCIVLTAVAPLPVVGTSTKTMLNMVPACLEGDELPPVLKGPQPYVSAAFVGGMGTFEILLKPENKSSKGKESKPYLLKGTVFDCKFTVTVPGQMITPGGPVADPVATKMGKCQFITTNVKVECS
jgi:hypothetical protein